MPSPIKGRRSLTATFQSPATVRIGDSSESACYKTGYYNDETSMDCFFDPYKMLMINLVPVFDGRTQKIQLPEGLRSVPKSLKPCMGDIPARSLGLIAYSNVAYRSQGHPQDLTIGHNIVWVVVLATPEE